MAARLNAPKVLAEVKIMPLRSTLKTLDSAVTVVRGLRLAVCLVDEDQTFPESGARLIYEAQRYFPTLPIILVSSRIGGFSRSFALFDTSNVIKHINTDEIDWRPAVPPTETDELPF